MKIPNGEGWHFLGVIILCALLRGIVSKNNSNFYCLNCPHSFRTKNKLESHKTVYGNKGFCNVVIPSEKIKISEFNQFQKI